MTTKKNESFGARIRRLRLARGYTLRRFAQQIGVSPTYMSQVEQDQGSPPAEDRIIRMAEALNEDPDELLAHVGRVAEDLPRIICRHPQMMASFLRTMRKLSVDEIAQLARQADELAKPQ